MNVVLGGTGLVGSHLLYELTSKGESVKALKRKGSDTKTVWHIFSYYSENPDSLFNRINWVEGDILDLISLEDVIDEGDLVYNCASMISFNSSHKYKIFKTNIYGTENIVNTCLYKKAGKLCHVSSISAIGDAPDGIPATEELIWAPDKSNSYYTISKFHSEMEVWRGIEEGLEAVIINPSVIIGPGDWNKSSSKLFQAIHNGLVMHYPPGTTGYVDVRDVVKGMILLMESKISGERFILNEGNYSYKEIFQLIAKYVGRKKPLYELKYWVGKLAWRLDRIKSLILAKSPQITRETIEIGFKHLFYSNNKIKQKLNFEFLPVEKSIQDTAQKFIEEIQKARLS